MPRLDPIQYHAGMCDGPDGTRANLLICLERISRSKSVVATFTRIRSVSAQFRTLASGAAVLNFTLLILAGCRHQEPLPSLEVIAETSEVSATIETDPVSHEGDAADDPAIWIHPDDADQPNGRCPRAQKFPEAASLQIA